MLIDVSMPIQTGAVFRPGSPPVDISARKCFHESEGDYETTILALPAHTATHVDLVFRDRTIEPQRMVGPGRLLDVVGVQDREIALADVARQPEPRPGDFVFFRTDWSRHAGTEKYSRHPELAEEVVEWLIAKRVNAVGIDALGLGRDRKHGQFDRLLAKNDVFIIENLAHLAAIPSPAFRVYCLPLSIENVDAIPARVLVETG